MLSTLLPVLLLSTTLQGAVQAKGGDGASGSDTYDVVIVGAGMAGLAAARHLLTSDPKIKFVVLEARDRLGGRTFSRKLDITLPANSPVPAVIDIGAAWVHGLENDAGVANPMVALAVQAGSNVIPVDETSGSYDPKGQPDPASWDELMAEMSDKFWAYYETLTLYDRDNVLARVVNTFIASKRPTLQQRRALMQVLATEIVLDYGADLATLSARYFSADKAWGGPDGLPRTGFGGLVEFLARDILSSVQLRKVVDLIDYSSSTNVIVSGRDFAAFSKFSVKAKYVIVTVPLGYLQKQSPTLFKPALSITQRAAMNSFGMGLLNKIILVWSDAWWSDILTDEWITIRNETNPGVFSEFYNLAATKAKLPVIVGFNAAGIAKVLEDRWTDAQVVARALASLQRVMPAGTTIPAPAQTIVTRWGSDPWTFGAYSYAKAGMKAGARAAAFAALGRGRVGFAGEHTHAQYPATVHGAYLSGIQEAQRVLGLIQA